MTYEPAGRFRRRQTRAVKLTAIRLDLPPDLAAAINLLAVKTRLPADQLIIDMLRDGLGSPAFVQHRLDLRQNVSVKQFGESVSIPTS